MASIKPRFDCNIFAITHVVNPNHFYLCDKSRFDLKFIEVVDAKLLESVKNSILISRLYEPQKDDVRIDNLSVFRCIILFNFQCVAFYVINKKKYIRCEVLDVKQMSNGDLNYILFAIDYGIPLFTNKREDIYPLPYSIKQLPSPIIQVGLDVLPTAAKFDYKKLMEVQLYHHEWTIEGMDRFWDFVGNDAVVVAFDQTMNNLKYKEYRGFGILHVVDNAGLLINVNDKLVNFDVALKAKSTEEFWKQFKKTNTPITEKWNDSFRSGGVLKDKMGGSGLPNFEKIFQKILYPEPRELNPRLKQINEKVMGWLCGNEGVATEVPEDFNDFVEKADSDYLLELYGTDDNDDDEENKIIDNDEKEEVPLTREEVRRELEKISVKEKSHSLNKGGLRGKLNQAKPAELFLPGGYQVQVAIQASPKKFQNRSRKAPKYKVNNLEYDDDQFVSASNCGLSVHSDDIEKW